LSRIGFHCAACSPSSPLNSYFSRDFCVRFSSSDGQGPPCGPSSSVFFEVQACYSVDSSPLFIAGEMKLSASTLASFFQRVIVPGPSRFPLPLLYLPLLMTLIPISPKVSVFLLVTHTAAISCNLPATPSPKIFPGIDGRWRGHTSPGLTLRGVEEFRPGYPVLCRPC